MKRIWLLAILALLLCVAQTAMALRPVAIGDVVHKGGGVFDVRAYGATGDGSTDDYTAINSAATAAAGNTLEFKSGTYVIGTNLTLDEDAFFYKGATIKPDSGIVITLTGALTAGPYQIFDESSGGTVTISNGMANEVLPQWWNGAVIQSFTDTDATPSVKKGRMFATANTGATTITMFDDGISGQVIRVFIGDGNTTLDFTGTNLKGNGGADWAAADGDALIAGFDGTDWYCMVSTPVGSLATDKDLVSGGGLTGGEDNVLVGADSDLTLDVVAGDGVIVNPDEIEVYGFVASDGTPNDAAVTDADGDVTFNYNITIDGITTFTTSATQAITGIGDTILANATRIELNPDANYTLTSTPHIADGTKGDLLLITAANAEANTVTLQDQDTLGGSNVELAAATRAITGKTVLLLAFDGSDWIEEGYSAPGIGDVLKDLVAGGGLTGGEDDVFPGADADVTVAVGAGDGVIVNADEIEIYGLVASDGTPNNALTVDATGKITIPDLSASRLVATDGSDVLVSSDLVNWVAGTASEITVTDDGDGTITLSADAALTTTADKDLVSGTGLTGGEDNVLVGVDSDLTLNVVAGDGVIANPDEIEVFGLVASDGTPNDSVRVDADGNTTIGPGTKHDGFVIRTAAEVQTLDAVQTTLDNFTLLDENTYHVEAWVIGVQSDGTDRASYHIAATVYRTGAGAATLQGTVTSLHTQESNASLDATFTVNVNDVRVSVTGIGAETWEWGTTLKFINLSN